MSQNVTLRMDEALLKKLRHKAVDEGMSLSAWIARKLADVVRHDEAVAAARARSMTRLRSGFSLGGKPLGRDEVHAR